MRLDLSPEAADNFDKGCAPATLRQPGMVLVAKDNPRFAIMAKVRP